MKKLLLTTAGLAFLASPLAAQTLPGADTDYGRAATNFWVEDDSNDLLQDVRSFACIIANTRPDITGQGNWEALIDEVDCGLKEADENYERGGIDYARVIINSTRASDTDPQNVVAYFDSEDGRYIADINVTQSPEQFAPYGEWTFAAKADQEITVGGITANIGEYGGYFVDIGPGDTDGTVEIKTGIGFEVPAGVGGLIPDGTLPESIASLIRFSGDDLEDAVYIGQTENGIMAGRTNGSAFYRANLSSDGTSLVQGSGACLARDNVWDNVYRYGLFDATTGDRINMTGGFGFEFGSGDSAGRGYIGNWGVWLDSQSNLFTPDSRTLDITADGPDGDVSRTLDWSPGKLIALSEVDNNLLTGDSFSFWDSNNSWTHSVAVYDETASNFTVTADTDYDGQPDNGASSSTLAASDLQQGEIVFFYSYEQNSNVIWDGGTTVKVFVREEVSADDTYTEASVTEFRSYNDENPALANFPISYSDFQNTSGYFSSQANADTAYFLTGLTPPDGFAARTLYIDEGDGSLGAGDVAVRYDFAVAMNETSTVTQFSSSATPSFSAGGWPYTEIKLVKASDLTGDCSIASNDSCPKFEWGFGAFNWDHSVIAIEGGEVVNIDRPKRGSITFDVGTMDRNDGKTLDFGADSGAAQEVDKFCSAANGSGLDCSMSPDDYDGKTLTVEYDGTSLQGLPGAVANVGSGDSWVYLVNLNDGTSFTSGGETYIVKALEVGEFLLPPAAGACDNIDFTSLSDLNLSIDDLPDMTDRTEFPLPDVSWDDQDETNLVCTVTHGDASNCGSTDAQ